MEIMEFLKGLDLREFNEISVCLRFVLAVLCGGIIGLEREHKHRPAGFRTHILVCIGSTMVMMISQYLISLNNSGLASYVCDPARLGAQVIAGIGFIGAGTIMVTKRRQVKGLTTAAGLWVSAIVGLALGVGFYEAGLYVTFLVLFVEICLSKLDWFLISIVRNFTVYVEYADPENLTGIMKKLKDDQVRIMDVEITKNHINEEMHISAVLTLKLAKRGEHSRAISIISQSEGVRAVEEL